MQWDQTKASGSSYIAHIFHLYLFSVKTYATFKLTLNNRHFIYHVCLVIFVEFEAINNEQEIVNWTVFNSD